MESKNFDFAAIANIIYRNRILFGVVVLVAAVLAVIFSGPTFLKPKFKSTAVVYPVNSGEYGDESRTEQLLQMFHASDIRHALIDKFDLYEAYDIEEGGPSSKYYMDIEYNNRIITSKTSYESVKLEVLDEDPEKAKAMADEVLIQLNNVMQAFHHTRGRSRSEAYKKQMDYQLQVIDSIEIEISKLSEENNLLEFESQTRELMKGYIESLSKGKNSAETKELKEWLEKMEKSGSMYQSLQNISEQAAEQYGSLTQVYLNWRSMGYEDVHYFDMVIEPEVADRKAWPVRWLIVLLAVVSASFLTLVILAIKKPK